MTVCDLKEQTRIKMRNQETTKHDYGHALLVAGAHGRMGCAILAARAALRSGCGLLTVHLPYRCVDPMQAAFPEAMVSIDPHPTLCSLPHSQLDRYTAIAAGPGLGTDEEVQQALHALLCSRKKEQPLVLDADALNILALNPDWLTEAYGAIITPHEREYHRLLGEMSPEEAAKRFNLIIVYKAHHTRVYHPDGRCYVNNTGNAGMATAGSGDVLTGILLGMLCSNHLRTSIYEIACRAVEIHGEIGDLAVEKQSESSLIASDLIENLRHVSTDITSY